MNRRKAMKSLAAVAAGATLAARPARAASKEAETCLKRWNIAKEFTLKVAEVMPDASYQFQPNPIEMGFGKLLTHLSAANTRYFMRIKGGEPPMKEPEKADKETTKKFIAQCFDWCAEILGGMSDAAFNEMYKGSGNAPAVSGRDLVLNGFIHTAHHRAQAEVYLRVKNLEPPRYAV
jgi:uncharacterized damage-inducible protein DinB